MKIFLAIICILFLSNCTKKKETKAILEELQKYDRPKIFHFPDSRIMTEEEINKELREFRQVLRYNAAQRQIRLHVNSPEGLRIRKTPSLDGEIVGTLNYKEDVLFLWDSEYKVYIDEIYDYWKLIISRDFVEGWVFGGYMNYGIYVEYEEPELSHMQAIVNIIANDLELFDYSKTENNNNLKRYLLYYHDITNYEIIEKKSFYIEMFNKTVDEYIVQSGSLRLYISNYYSKEESRYSLNSIEIEISESNYLHLFPYKTKDEYMNDENFRKKDHFSTVRIDDNEELYFVDRGENSWRFSFNENGVNKVRFWYFQP